MRIQRERRKARRSVYRFMPNGLKVRLHQNRAERKLQVAALKSGWEIYYIGLLDFLCYNPKTGETLFIEVKSTSGDSRPGCNLSRYQKVVAGILEKKSIKVVFFRADKDNPYKIFNPQNLEK